MFRPEVVVAGSGDLVTAVVLTLQRAGIHAEDGQTVKLALPQGFSFVKGHEAEKKIDKGGGLVQVSWHVKAGPKEGEFTLEATSGGARATRTVRIRMGGLLD